MVSFFFPKEEIFDDIGVVRYYKTIIAHIYSALWTAHLGLLDLLVRWGCYNQPGWAPVTPLVTIDGKIVLQDW